MIDHNLTNRKIETGKFRAKQESWEFQESRSRKKIDIEGFVKSTWNFFLKVLY